MDLAPWTNCTFGLYPSCVCVPLCVCVCLYWYFGPPCVFWFVSSCVTNCHLGFFWLLLFRGVMSLQMLKPLTVRKVVMSYKRNWSLRYKNWLKTQPKNFLLMELKKTCETQKLVRSSRGRLRWKVILVPFLYIYNACAFFWKDSLLFDLPSYIRVNILGMTVLFSRGTFTFLSPM
jgi:hypothetical protein